MIKTASALHSELETIDIGSIAVYLHSLYPKYSRCELVMMLASVAPVENCICRLCNPERFPDCLTYKRAASDILMQSRAV